MFINRNLEKRIVMRRRTLSTMMSILNGDLEQRTSAGGNGEENRHEEADTEYDDVKVLNGDLEQRTSAGGNDQKHTFKCVVICLGILCVILAAMLIALSSYVFVSELQHSKDNQSALLAYKDHLVEVVGNLTSANENLVMSHSNLSRSCDILQNETQELRTELAKIKEVIRLNLTCSQSPIDAYCHIENKSSVCRPCEVGWIHNRFSCYVVFDHENESKRKTWSDSRDDCRRNGADLVVINDEEEQALLYDNSYGSTDASNGYWLGLSKPAETGKWSWVDGTEVTLRYWTGVNGTGSNSHCALIWKNEQKKPFGWSTVYCKDKRRWMCEKKIFSYQVGKK
ncbi:CD209 antigen-like protein A [Merluccius polli]|uniref:CD209 antigen-like protein A n=1 Tax=Merluccius polli TaxID=89951 RepID=A0AA47NBA3_MERPO|nr:CD209 antigen-like protein A [Merluccius polli]